MKKIIYIVLLIISIVANAQRKQSDYFQFHKEGEKYLKPIKYVLFDSLASNSVKVKDKQSIYFYINNNRFIHRKKYKIDTCSINILQKIELENPDNLRESVYNYFKKEKEKVEKKTNSKMYVLPPITGFYPYFNIYILEKTKNNKLLKYEVDWEYFSF